MIKGIPKETWHLASLTIRLENVEGCGMIFREQPSIEAEYQFPPDVSSLICHYSHYYLLLFH